MHLMQPDVVYGVSKMESLLPPSMRMGASPEESKQKLTDIFGKNSDYKPMLDDYNGLGHPGKYAKDYAAYYSAGRTGESFDHMAKEYSKGGFISDALKNAFQHGQNAKNNTHNTQQQQNDKKPVDNPPDMGYNSENRNKSSRDDSFGNDLFNYKPFHYYDPQYEPLLNITKWANETKPEPKELTGEERKKAIEQLSTSD